MTGNLKSTISLFQVGVSENAIVNNLTMYDGAILDVLDGKVNLSGDVTLYSGSFVTTNPILSDASFDSLTFVNGISHVYAGGVNTGTIDLSGSDFADNKTLNLANVNENFSTSSNGGVKIGKWDEINIGTIDKVSNMKLVGDLSFNGTNKLLNINKGSSLDVSGYSPANYTIDGNVYNNGLLDFTVRDYSREADDLLNILENYTADTNAVIALHVNPVAETSDVLRIMGDVKGTTKLLLKTSEVFEAQNKILFVEAPNDDVSTQSGFEVWRV